MASKSDSSWHPAMMPNSAADVVTKDTQSTSKDVELPIFVDSVAAPAAEDAPPTEILPDQIDHDEADAWLVSEEAVATEPIEISQPTGTLHNTESTGGDTVQMEPTTEPSDPAEVLPEPESAEVPSLSRPTEKITSSEHDDDSADAWFKNTDEGEGGGAWLLQDEGLHKDTTCDSGSVEKETQVAKPAVEEDANPEPAESQTEETDATAVRRTASVTSTAQHSSSMSFARTVSHEISFPGDDDAEWSLGRTETEAALEFMPESNQTNSFPSAPPMDSATSAQVGLPLTSNQASDVMEEDKREAEFEEEEEHMMRSPEADSSASWRRHDTARTQHVPHRSIGGELEDAAVMEEEVRFEEGLPLIPHAHGLGKDDAQQSTAHSNPDPFREQKDNEDDFFSQVGKNEGTQNDNEHDVKSLLERKSTTQVMAAIDDGRSLTRHSTLNDFLEEDADNSAEGAALDIPDKAAGSPVIEDLASKWEQAFGDDDDDEFLLDDSMAETENVDATAFLGSDDEGLLDDELDTQATIGATSRPQEPVSNPYTPASVSAQSTTPYTLAASTGPMLPSIPGYGQPQQPQPLVNPYGSGQFGQTPQPLRPEPAKTQSFVDKSKAGYSSPYDLPTDLVKPVKPRKRPSLQKQISTDAVPSPPTSGSFYSPGQSTHPPPATTSVPPFSNATRPPLGQKASAPALRSKESFFEELPVSSKPRTASRQSQRAPSPGQYVPAGSAPHQAAPQPPPMSRTVPPPTASHMVPPPVPQPAPPPAALPAQYSSDEVQTTPPDIANLVPPPRTNPYANVQSQPSAAVMPPSNSSSRYSPAPPGLQGGGVSITSRYSPAPSSGSRPNSSYGAGPPHAALPHLPRTSSPLAHFDSSGAAEGQPYDRRAGSTFEPRLTRMSSLPPTREVDEEEDEEVSSPGNRSFSANHPVTTSPTAKIDGTRYSPAPPHAPAHHATPPLSPVVGRAVVASPAAMSPPKRTHSNYAPQPAAASAPAQASFMPPPRARTQSPSALHIDARKPSKPTDYAPRPLSVHSPPAGSLAPVPATTKPAAQSSGYAPTNRTRGQSITNMMPPTDGRERDPLERWRGAPVMAWGVGGTFITSFPKSIPRYAMGQTVPVTIRTVGEVKVQNVKDLDPLQDGLAKFPGPLKGKSKKKEAVAWLTAGIDSQEREIPDVSFHSQLSLEAKRSVERLLLWKLLRIFVEHDGILEGTPAVDKAVRQVLAPETAELPTEGASLFTGAEVGSGSTSMKADGVDESAVEKIRLDLLKGDRETAVWAAVDKRLWGHAMLISQTVSANLYKQVAQEFVRKEVNYPGHNNESLAALYKILSGNYEDCVDELVPSHARAGLQLVSTETSSGPTKDAMDGLDKWRETLTLVLSNRSSGDIRGLNALGKLLSSYGRAEAAHICFIFSRSLSVFGGLDDPNSDFVLVSSDHKRQSDQFAKETEALLLSEVYEYGLTLGSGVAASAGAPHLAAYKLQHAVTLAEYGFRDKAIQYCDAIASAIIAQTRRSPYHHPILEASVEDFLARLKSSPKDASSSWMSKPTMGKVSDSMWNRFNKFVSGDEDGNNHAGPDGDNGPFARIAPSPNISRPPSTSNFDVYGSSAGYQSTGGAPLASSGAATSRYAPASSASHTGAAANPYAPAATQPQHTSIPASRRRSQEYAPNAYEPAYPGGAGLAQSQPGGGGGGGYQPIGYPGSAPSGHQPTQTPAFGYAEPVSTTQSVSAVPSGHQPLGLQESPVIHSQPSVNDNTSQGYEPQPHGYEAPQTQTAADSTDYNDQQGAGSGGYEPPSFQPYGYEPSSYQPDSNDDDEEPKPKKKSFMDDDDDDDIPALKKPQDQSKSEKDRENEELFRRVAEEDAKRAAAAAASTKKGWGFGGWFGGSKKGDGSIGDSSSSGKPIKAKLGEQSSFVYDPDLGRWVNKKPGAENVEIKKATPPPPRAAGPRSVSGTPPPSSTHTPPPAADRMSVPPMGMPPRPSASSLSTAQSMDNLYTRAGPGGIARTASSGAMGPPPSRPSTSMSNASSIDDLLGAPAPRKAGAKKPRKGGRYVDVMAKS
ncbi:hypothetical protein E4U43_003749 [Claviceps pusilla]|uniref:Protein transport protein sec16 n=1 Tax=Claviceps pusilla TaxID=123648 RepID=A0A9P7T0G0_9HYPO|nr:hypothetical protein E4U43_003749 [Claviceps pusilla]